MREGVVEMTEQEAKDIINTPGYPNVAKSLEAIGVALDVLGEDATMREIYAWAEGREDEGQAD